MKKLVVLALFIGLLTSNVASASFDKNLNYGAKGASVKEVQEFLTDQGFYSAAITGNYYSLTLKAVKAFQSKGGIRPSGYWNLATRTAANNILAAALVDSDNEQTTEPSSAPEVKAPTPVVIAPTNAPVVDWCSNIAGDQAVVPDGLMRDTLNNCVAQITYPSAPTQPVVPVKAADTTPPQLVRTAYSSCNNLSHCTSQYPTFCNTCSNVLYSDPWYQGHFGMSVITDEPTTLVASFYPVTDDQGNDLTKFAGMNGDQVSALMRQNTSDSTVITFSDPVLRNIHEFPYDSVPLAKNTAYRVRYDYTDASGNKSVWDYQGGYGVGR